MGCVYKITNNINGKSYVGLTSKTSQERWSKHVRDSMGAKRTQAIHHAIRKYGPENFAVSILFESLSLEELNSAELELIESLGTLSPNGYNLHSGGNSHKISDDTKVRMSLAQIGKKQLKETKDKRSMALSGKRQSPEHVLKRAKSKMKPVIELTTGTEFESVNAAAKYFGIKARGISKNLNGQTLHYKNKRFKAKDSL